MQEFYHFARHYEQEAIDRVAMVYLFGENADSILRAPKYRDLLSAREEFRGFYRKLMPGLQSLGWHLV